MKFKIMVFWVMTQCTLVGGEIVNIFEQEYGNSRHEVTWATKFCIVAPDICGSSLVHLLKSNLLPPASSPLS